MSAYRDVAMSDADAATLLDVAQILRRFNEAVGGGTEFGVHADDLQVLVLRYERAARMEGLHAEVLQFQKREAGRAHLPSARGQLHVIEGGCTA